MKILAIDTATHACSAALLYNNIIIQRFTVAIKQHTAFILPMVNELLEEANLGLEQLDAIAFGQGPGSFTGVRLASSIVQGLALVNNTPVIKISTLRALAQEIFENLGDAKVFIALDARMEEVYWGEYQIDNDDIMQAVISDKLIKTECIKVDNTIKIYDDTVIKDCNINLQAKTIIKIAVTDFIKGLATTADQALPVYLREEIAWGVAK